MLGREPSSRALLTPKCGRSASISWTRLRLDPVITAGIARSRTVKGPRRSSGSSSFRTREVQDREGTVGGGRRIETALARVAVVIEGLRPGTEGGGKIGASHTLEIETIGGAGKTETGRRAETGDIVVMETGASDSQDPDEKSDQNDPT